MVEARQRFGDWEGDGVEGAKGSGVIATHVERKSRYLVSVKLDNKKAQPLADNHPGLSTHPQGVEKHSDPRVRTH